MGKYQLNSPLKTNLNLPQSKAGRVHYEFPGVIEFKTDVVLHKIKGLTNLEYMGLDYIIMELHFTHVQIYISLLL